MKLLDLFCGAGGAAMGYYRAGFTDITGVDIKPMPRYPFKFIQGDTLEYLATHGGEYDVIHASPPCQHYSRISIVHNVSDKHPDLVGITRDLLEQTGKPWIIENVMGSPLRNAFILCGSSLGLGTKCHDGIYRQLRRHRKFEATFFIFSSTCTHNGEPIGVYGHGGGQFKTVWQGGNNRGYMGSFKERKAAMGIDWMNKAELTQAIPPAYTEYIGKQLMRILA